MDNEDHISLLELDEAVDDIELDLDELDLNIKLDLEDDDADDDFEKVEELTLPLVSKWDLPEDGLPIYGSEVPVMKEDGFIQDYRNYIGFHPTEDPPPPPPPAHACSICFEDWTMLHPFCSLPCGHVFGAQCITKWFQTNSLGMCPQCNVLCSFDVRPLYATPLCIPAADKGVVDQEISTRRFPFSRQGIVKFKKFELGRRNFALKKRSDAKKRLAVVVGRKNDLMKRRTCLLDRRDSVLNRAKALEQRGGSLRLRADALRLRAYTLGRLADEYLLRAKACEGRAIALSQRNEAYNQRVEAFKKRWIYFLQCYRDNLPKNT